MLKKHYSYLDLFSSSLFLCYMLYTPFLLHTGIFFLFSTFFENSQIYGKVEIINERSPTLRRDSAGRQCAATLSLAELFEI